jgi:hypothetical protein
MNKMLSNIVGFLNGFLAVVFLIIGAAVGNQMDAELGGAGIIVGLFIGLVLSVIFCGVLAIFISMRDELVEIKGILHSQDN